MSPFSAILAVISGIVAALGLLKLLFELRAAQRDPTKGVPEILRGQWLWVLIGIVGTVLCAVAVVSWMGSQLTYTVVAQLFVVRADEKGPQLSAIEIPGTGPDIDLAGIKSVQAWVGQTIRVNQGVSSETVHGRLVVPSDAATRGATVEMTPEGPIELVASIDSAGGKSRAPLTQAMFSLGQPIEIELRRPGYASWTTTITPGTAVDQVFELAPVPVRIGIEPFAGSDTLATRLSVDFDGFEIVDPASLARLRAKIQEEKLQVSQSPIQQSYRSTLGVDYILTGSLR